MDLIGWLIVGLVAGALARLLVPGRDPMGILGTLLLDLAGSLVGGFLGTLLVAGDRTVNPAGLIGSVIGAVLVLLIYRAVARRTADRPPPGADGPPAAPSRGPGGSAKSPGRAVRRRRAGVYDATRPGGGDHRRAVGGGRHGNADDSRSLQRAEGVRGCAGAQVPPHDPGRRPRRPVRQPADGVVARSTIAFFDRYLEDRRDGPARLRAGAEVPGLARLDGFEE